MAPTNRDLFQLARTHKFARHESLLRLMRPEQDIGADAEDPALEVFLGNFLKAAERKWNSAGNHSLHMEKKHGSWLDQTAIIPAPAITTPKTTPKKKKMAEAAMPKKPTPRKDFSDLSKSQKDRSTAELRASHDSDKLLHAAKSVLKRDGKADVAAVIDDATTSPSRATKLRRLSGIAGSLEKTPRKPLSMPTKMTGDECLAHLFYTGMSKEAYVSTRLLSKSHGADIWASYNELIEAKNRCRPADIHYEEMSVIVPLVERLRHNDNRFIELFDANIKEHLQDIEDGGTLLIEVEGKIGFDGSTGNAIYNQKFNLENRDKTEESLLSTCYVPLQYRTSKGDIIFTNPVPQGATFCQPVRLEYKKETPAASKEIDAWIDSEMAALAFSPISIQIGSKTIEFRHIVRRTMMDGKAKSAVTDTTSCLRCFLCGATPKAFNDIDNLIANFPTNEELLVYGSICDFHAWCRSFDAINSLSDKLPLKKWRVTKKEEKDIVEGRKKNRQKKYKEEMSLDVDVPRSGGAGNSNTGNVARRAFQDEEAFARITEVDQGLIHNIHTLLICINADAPIDLNKFKAKGYSTARQWAELYGWYNMPVTMHQLFFHAWESLKLSSLPMSFFTEQSLESCNKFFKSDREHHTRKDSRLHTIQDQFHRQSDKSDLAIALKLHGKRRQKPSETLPQDVLDLLINEDESTEEDAD